MFMVRIPRICSEYNKIPHQVLIDILMVFEHGIRDQIKDLPNNLICKANGDFWTTWEEVLDLRDTIKKDDS